MIINIVAFNDLTDRPFMTKIGHIVPKIMEDWLPITGIWSTVLHQDEIDKQWEESGIW